MGRQAGRLEAEMPTWSDDCEQKAPEAAAPAIATNTHCMNASSTQHVWSYEVLA